MHMALHGTLIETGPQDWQVLQQRDGFASVVLSGTWRVPKAAIDVGTQLARPMVRLLSEMDGYPLLPWQDAQSHPAPDGHSGTWRAVLTLPAGGPYRIEAGLDTVSTLPGLRWMFRGDVRVHIGVGDVFVVAGQSNASGYAKDNAFDPPDLSVHMLRNRGIWDLACHPLNESTAAENVLNIEMGVSGASPYLSFGRAFAALSRRPVGLVPTALGGQPLSRWDKRVNGELLDNMVQRIQACGGEVAGILWYQGESDAMAGEHEDYLERFAYFVNSLREALGQEVPVFTFQLNRTLLESADEGWGAVREAQRRAAQELPGLYVLPTLDCGVSDAIHNDAYANLRLGERLSRQCGHVLLHGAPYFAPDIREASFANGKLRLSFDNLQGAFSVIDNLADRAGFSACDENGIIPLASLSTDPDNPAGLLLTPVRSPGKGASVSFASEANPTAFPPLDGVTSLPPLAFFEFPINFDTEE